VEHRRGEISKWRGIQPAHWIQNPNRRRRSLLWKVCLQQNDKRLALTVLAARSNFHFKPSSRIFIRNAEPCEKVRHVPPPEWRRRRGSAHMHFAPYLTISTRLTGLVTFEPQGGIEVEALP
jgi:hypothetical protein